MVRWRKLHKENLNKLWTSTCRSRTIRLRRAGRIWRLRSVCARINLQCVSFRLSYTVSCSDNGIWRSWDRASLMYSFKYNQLDTTLYNILYYCQYSTCFRRFLRPSSGAENCTHSIWYMWSLLAATAVIKNIV
jgi:hypothetical protein